MWATALTYRLNRHMHVCAHCVITLNVITKVFLFLRLHNTLGLYASPYNVMSLDYMSFHSLAPLNQVPDLIMFYGHYNSSPNSFPISSNIMFVVPQRTNLLIKGSRGEKDNAYDVLNAVLQLK